MHTIEFSNGNDTVHVAIESATRERLTVKIGESRIVTSVTAYLSFAEAFAEAFHALQGTATLRDIDENEVIDVIFSHRGVRIEFHNPLSEKTLQTDQSYMTESMRQIGIWNRL
ncbi:hypothetical protein [Exiguobacterium sp. s189]|uniref:hypothetical protein n=1 Tax=Exiguobacterium sp. s189 TaxID=2751263 RepID=UPI001BE7F7B0|nr:hypothetical protein [Exiguobacterium sp. s189]